MKEEEEQNNNRNSIFYNEDVVSAKLSGMLLIVAGIFMLVIAGIDVNLSLIFPGLLLLSFGICLVNTERQILISFPEQAVSVSIFFWQIRFEPLCRTIHFNNVSSLEAAYFGKKQRGVVITIRSDSLQVSLYGYNHETGKAEFEKILRNSVIRAGHNPWGIRSDDNITEGVGRKILLAPPPVDSATIEKLVKLESDDKLVAVPATRHDEITTFCFADKTLKPWKNNRVFTLTDIIGISLIFYLLWPQKPLVILLAVVYAFMIPHIIYTRLIQSRWVDMVRISPVTISFRLGPDWNSPWKDYPLLSLRHIMVTEKPPTPFVLPIEDRHCLEFHFRERSGEETFVYAGWGWSPEALEACARVINAHTPR